MAEFPGKLLEYHPQGLFCKPAGIYIDPQNRVDKAIITHAHADHARRGMGEYLCHPLTAAVLKHRLGKKISVQSFEYGESFNRNGVRFSLHPAGHTPGSAQVRMEYKGEVWVVSGDFKIEDDGLTTPYEVVKCHGLVMESTFALPVYQWRPQHEIAEEIKRWWEYNTSRDVISALMVYPFGKAQRMMHLLSEQGIPLLAHSNIIETNETLLKAGLQLPPCGLLDMHLDKNKIAGHILLLSGLGNRNKWRRAYGRIEFAHASGWMQLKKGRQMSRAEQAFVISDHADWKGLNQAVHESGAEKVVVMHGYEEVYCRWLQERGIEAYPLSSLDGRNGIDDKLAEEGRVF